MRAQNATADEINERLWTHSCQMAYLMGVVRGAARNANQQNEIDDGGEGDNNARGPVLEVIGAAADGTPETAAAV